ncbi:MAG: serine/threonine-protein phosphatase, partial [candidate division Zixibacteria bacterium]|nr:serine/threonine-protein phosphatase [candidate division Zixibacteria bacterium]
LRASGELELPSESDLIIGVVPGYSYTAHRISLEKGESVFIYTDGITEAFNEEEQEFGEERLEKILRENHQLLADEIGHKVYSEVVSFRGKREQSDDITMLILRRP